MEQGASPSGGRWPTPVLGGTTCSSPWVARRPAGAADTIVSKLGLTGLQFTNVSNGCATGGIALFTAAQRHPVRALRPRHRRRLRQARAGAFRVNTQSAGLGDWYGASGLALTTQFFGMKINRYMHEHGITPSTLAKVAAKAFRNGSQNPMAWRRKPVSEPEILDRRCSRTR